MSRQHQLSKVHSKYGEVKKEEDMLTELVPKAILRLKSKKVMALLEANQVKMQEAQKAGNIQLQNELMQENMDLQKKKMILSNLIGNSTILK
jgi:DNA primase